jgi:excisionase family DNA binding protein
MSGRPSIAEGSTGADALATVGEVAAFLRVPPKTVYQWRYSRLGPPAYRVGRHLRFRWEDVDEWLAERGDEPQRPVCRPPRNVSGVESRIARPRKRSTDRTA